MALLRTVRALPELAAPTPRILGVDDFALARGRRYRTVLVDIEARRPIDLLPDRTAATFAAWLTVHPGVEVICRDRGGNYAEGARQGAPEATQVADRFHLMQNLAEALERLVGRLHPDLSVPPPTSPPPMGPLEEPLAPYTAYFARRWQEGCWNAATLCPELRAQGYRGSATTVRGFVAPFRDQALPLPQRPRRSGRLSACSWTSNVWPPSSRSTRSWLPPTA